MSTFGAASLESLAQGIIAGQRSALGRAITLVESTKAEHRQAAQCLLHRLLPHAGGGHRIGITGMPGAGKSTLIDAFGQRLLARGHKLAVLAVDPSSVRTGGSILGDKTRMTHLAKDPRAFIRPSPSGGSLGGVARRTRESIVLCEAAGYDVVFVETVGVGQSEAAVAEMVDFFMCLTLAGGGDGLQGIKRGVLEWADALVVTKADGENEAPANAARREYAAALQLMTPRASEWRPAVLTCSAVSGAGLDALWETVLEHRRTSEAHGSWGLRRSEQDVRWMWRRVEESLGALLREHPNVQRKLATLEADVRAHRKLPDDAATELLDAFVTCIERK